MRLWIAGGRTVRRTAKRTAALTELARRLASDGTPIKAVVTGGCRGADFIGMRWALNNQIPFLTIPAPWNRFGRAAGPKRNGWLCKRADALAVFPGGPGTADSIRRAERRGLPIYRLP